MQACPVSHSVRQIQRDDLSATCSHVTTEKHLWTDANLLALRALEKSVFPDKLQCKGSKWLITICVACGGPHAHRPAVTRGSAGLKGVFLPLENSFHSVLFYHARVLQTGIAGAVLTTNLLALTLIPCIRKSKREIFPVHNHRNVVQSTSTLQL